MTGRHVDLLIIDDPMDVDVKGEENLHVVIANVEKTMKENNISPPYSMRLHITMLKAFTNAHRGRLFHTRVAGDTPPGVRLESGERIAGRISETYVIVRDK